MNITNVGEIVRKKRIEQNMTQLELATKLGYDSVQFVSLMERSLSKVPNNRLGQMFKVLKFTKKEQDAVLKFKVDSFKSQMLKEVTQGFTL